MRPLFHALVCAALLQLVACSHPQPREPQTDAALRAMTYNIFAGNDLARQSNLERIGALIDSLDVDVVMLQEVDRRTKRSGNVDQATVIAERAGMHVVFGPSMVFDGGHFGNTILSRFPIRQSHVQALMQPDTTAEPRSLLHVVVETPRGPLHVVATHLDHRADPTARNAQLLELLAYLAGAIPRGEPVLLGGDLNARPETSLVRALGLDFTDAWSACGTGNGYTFRSDAPDRRIDYILLAGLVCATAEVVGTQLSDHRPLLVDVRRRF